MSILIALSFALVFCATLVVLTLFIVRTDAQNRMVAIELLAILTAAFIGLLAIAWRREELLDVTLAWTLFGFISSAAMSAFILKER